MSSVVRNALPLIVTATLLAACGGGGTGSLAPAKTATKTTIAPGQGTLALTISIPHPTAASASKRSAAYISSSTQSIAITIASTAPVLQEAVGLTPASNPNCTTVSSTTTCGITIPLSAGSFSATFATYDGPVVSGAATGNLLSQGQSIPVTVTAGQTNTVTATLDGVPTSITIAPSSGSTITGTQSGGFTVPYSAQGLTIEALDADGNVILGAGAPTFAVTATATKYTVTQPASGTPNQITLESATGGSGTLSVTATPPDGGFSCSATGVVCTASATLASTLHEFFAVSRSALYEYTSPDNQTWTLAATNATSIANPSSIAAMPNGDVIVLNAGEPAFPPIIPGSPATLLIFAPPYTSAPTVNSNVSVPSIGGQMSGAADASGNLVFTDAPNLGVLAPPYTGTPTFTSNPDGGFLALDPAGDAVTSSFNGTFFLTAPSYASSTTISSTVGGVAAVSANGTLAIANTNVPYELSISAAPYVTSIPTVISLPYQPGGLTFDSNGNLWVYIADGAHVQKYAAPFSSGESPAFDIVSGNQPAPLTADSSGDVFAVTSYSSVTEFGPSGTTVTTITPATGVFALAYVK